MAKSLKIWAEYKRIVINPKTAAKKRVDIKEFYPRMFEVSLKDAKAILSNKDPIEAYKGWLGQQKFIYRVITDSESSPIETSNIDFGEDFQADLEQWLNSYDDDTVMFFINFVD